MKKQSRLTALLLALCMLMSTLPVSALADGILTLEDYLSAVQRVQQELSEPSIPVEEENAYTLTRTTATETIVRETVTGELSSEGESAFPLPLAGKLELSTAAAADAYQWQIDVGGVWANIVGDTAAAVTLTYAKVQNALSGGTARVRCAMTQDGQTVYSAVAAVTVDETVKTQTVEGTEEISAVSYTSEAPKSLARTLNAGVGTYDLKGNDTPSTYSVVINYEFENGSIAADQYTASLAAGTSFSATVTFPTVQGYLPYLNEVQQNSLELNYTAINQDHTYNVVYKPTNVNYTVIHYQQNLDNDNYTEVERETKQGLTKSPVPDVAKKYEGFYALLYEKPEIAADGSTEVEVYYDRYYYLMNFDLDGGYGVEPIYARYGAPISVPTEDEEGKKLPIKAGYTFSGWTLDGTNTVDLPDTMPAENRTYKAVWTPDATAKVTIVFWGENANDEEYSYIKSIQTEQTPGTAYSVNGSSYVHQHDTTCYGDNVVGQKVSTRQYSIVGEETEGYIGEYGSSGWLGFEKEGNCIYINGTWYVYTGNAEAGSTLSAECGYLNKALWTWVGTEPESVTVAADGSSVVNVYYDRTEKTLTFKYNYKNYIIGGSYQSTETITAKWGSNISKQYKEIAAKAGSTFWTLDEGGSGPYTNYFGVMPQTSATYYNRGKTGGDGTMTYWGQDLNGEYTVTLFEVKGVGGYYVTDEDRYEFEGFTYHHGTSNNSDCAGAKFYYTRNRYDLVMNNGEINQYVFTSNEDSNYYAGRTDEGVYYEAELSSYKEYIPTAPSFYEPGSVTFGGWYLNPECTGAEYKLDEHTMPADNVLLYAKWVPVTHTVEFYLDKAALDAGTKLESHPAITVRHGSKADPTPATPTNGSYTFVGWFYMDNDVEKAFDFANMPVNKDLQVYGKWSSNVLKEYTIYYKYKDAAGNEIEIADPTTGSGLAGITKTFEAKGGTDLYADYQEGYFPVIKSHSLTLDINATEENDTNVYTFWYVQKKAVPYTVKYLDKETGKTVAPEKTVSDNRKAVVTETFVPVSNMMPDAYQKRLVVSAEEGAVNEIIFYYTEDTTHAYYKITHYTENLATDAQGHTTWTEYASSQAVGDIGTTYTADSMTIPGFTYDSTVPGTVASGELTANGLELKLYYTRNSYPYQVRYLEQGTGKQLADPKDGNGKYGQVVSEDAKDIANYDAVVPTSKTLDIRIEESQTEAKLNVITFYYKEKEATINYDVVGPDGCGTVTPTSEKLKVLTGTAQGSTANASTNAYKFVGWYTDEACTKPVNANWVDANNKITPVKADVSAWANVTTYYAKFEYNPTTLTVTKTGLTDDNESAIFTLTKEGDTKVIARFSLKNGQSVTIDNLTVGETYTVTEESGWTWHYEGLESKTVTIQAPCEITFTNKPKPDKWLYAESSKHNVFQGEVSSDE